MSPLQAVRLWARRAPAVERGAAGAAAALLVAGALWVGWPGARAHSQPSAAGAVGAALSAAAPLPAGSGRAGTAGQGTPAVAARPGGGVPTAGGSAYQGRAGGTPVDLQAAASGPNPSGPGPVAPVTRQPAAAAACPGTGGPSRGVTANQLNIAVTLEQIVGPAANSSFGIATPADQQTIYQAVIDSLNANGGIACRKVVPTFYTVNPVDSGNLQQTCLDIVQSDPFAEIDFGSYAGQVGAADCFAQNRIPFFGTYFLSAAEAAKYYPYMFDVNTFDSLDRNTVFALRDQGFFTGAKLGFIYRSCYPDVIRAFDGWLAQAGVTGSNLVTYDVGCPTSFDSPGDLEQAILKFQQDGVDHVTVADFVGDFANFTKIAEQQNFRPRYGLPDEALVQISYGNLRPDYSNIAGAVAITASRAGEEHTPGYTVSAGTARCNSILQARGEAPVWQEPAGAGGDVCDELWMLQAAADHAPVLQQGALGAGLHNARTIDYSYPRGPADFSGADVTVGGQYWRPLEFQTACDCWQVTSPTFRPSYP